MDRMLRRILGGQGRREDLALLLDVANRIEGHTSVPWGCGGVAGAKLPEALPHEFEYMIDHGGRSIVESQGWRQRNESQSMAEEFVNIEVNGVPMKARKAR